MMRRKRKSHRWNSKTLAGVIGGTAAAVLGTFVLYRSLNDLRRYVRIKQM
jgi:hypothetical protein